MFPQHFVGETMFTLNQFVPNPDEMKKQALKNETMVLDDPGLYFIRHCKSALRQT